MEEKMMKLPKMIHKALPISIATSLLLAGCASTGTGPGGKPTAEQVRNERVAQGAGVGCVGGALAGALIGLAAGGSGRHALVGAAAGCAAGAVAGAVYGDYVDARAQSYANAQDRYNALAKAANSDIQKSRAYNAKARSEVSQLRSEIASLQVRVRNGSATQAEYQQKVAEAQSKASELRDRAQELRKAANLAAQDNLQAQKAAFEQEARQLETMAADVGKQAQS